ncbi:hypothetical protein [Streptomyces sp. NPDC048419]|uniref:hypothetical protein n=1 Tax=Streptomyces sp. NPDC048419 TaxID=3365547 RepID=UPI003711EAC9
MAARLWRGKSTASRTDLALEMVHDLAALFPDRTIHVTGDAAYHSIKAADLPTTVTFTTRCPVIVTRRQRGGGTGGCLG